MKLLFFPLPFDVCFCDVCVFSFPPPPFPLFGGYGSILPLTTAFAVSQRIVGEISGESLVFACREVVYCRVVLNWWEKMSILLWLYFLISSYHQVRSRSHTASLHSMNASILGCVEGQSCFGLRTVFKSSLKIVDAEENSCVELWKKTSDRLNLGHVCLQPLCCNCLLMKSDSCE